MQASAQEELAKMQAELKSARDAEAGSMVNEQKRW